MWVNSYQVPDIYGYSRDKKEPLRPNAGSATTMIW